MSRGAIERLVILFESELFEGRSINGSLGQGRQHWEGSCSKQQSGHHEDVYLGQCLGSLKVFPLDTENAQGQQRWTHWIASQGYAGSTGVPGGGHELDPFLIASHHYKNRTTRRSDYMKMDRKYEAEKMKDIPVPGKPHTFKPGKDIPGLKNKDLIYVLK